MMTANERKTIWKWIHEFITKFSSSCSRAFSAYFISSILWMKLKCVHVSIKWLYEGKNEKTSAINHQQFSHIFILLNSTFSRGELSDYRRCSFHSFFPPQKSISERKFSISLNFPFILRWSQLKNQFLSTVFTFSFSNYDVLLK